MKNGNAMKFYQDICVAYKAALRKTIQELLLKDEQFYYVVLVVDENGLPPVFSAWSKESYARECENLNAEQAAWMKWSYSESPYFDFGKANFLDADGIWLSKGSIDDFKCEEWVKELERRVNSLEECFASLNKEGLISDDESRKKTMVNVETTPPSPKDTERARRLNPPESIKEWLDEAAE